MATGIVASKVLVGSSGGSPLGPFQIGPDFKMYFSIYSNNSLGAITNPDLPCAACECDPQAVTLNPNSLLSIPNFIDSDLMFLSNTGELTKKENILVAPNPASDFLSL